MYWYGGTGNWSDHTNHWSNNSGNSPASPASNAPTASDDAVFDGNSGSDNYTTTIDATAVCKDLIVAKPTGAGKKVTIAGTSGFTCKGNFNLETGSTEIVWSFTGGLNLGGYNGDIEIHTGGLQINSQTTFEAYSATKKITLHDNFNMGSTVTTRLYTGTLDLNGFTLDVTLGNAGTSFEMGSSYTRTLIFGSGKIKCGIFNCSGTNITITKNTGTVELMGSSGSFTGGGKSYYKLLITNASAYPAGSNIYGANTFEYLEINGTAYKGGIIKFDANQTITNTLTINGNTAINRLLIASTTLGTQRTITTTGGAVVITNCDFKDIVATGDAGEWDLSSIAGGSGNCGGCTGITFTIADDWYWYKDTGSISSQVLWFTETGGAGTRIDSDARNAKTILPQDTCYFDSGSFTAGSKTVTQDLPRIGSVIFTGATNTPTFTPSTVCSVYGSITLISGMTLSTSNQAYKFEGRDNVTLDSGGKSWGKAIELDKWTGSVTLKSDFITTAGLNIYSGEFDSVDGATSYNVKARTYYQANISGAILTLGANTFELTGGASNTFNMVGTSSVINCGTSTIKFSGNLIETVNFQGYSHTFYDVWFATTGAYPMGVYGTVTFHDFKINAGREINFGSTTTITVTTFTALGTSGAHIVIHNTSGTIHATLAKAGGGVITGCDYIDIQEITGSPSNTWFIGPNSTDAGSTCTDIYLSNNLVNTSVADTVIISSNVSLLLSGGLNKSNFFYFL